MADGMLVFDVFTERTFFDGEPASQTVKITIEVIGALLVIGLGKWQAARRRIARTLIRHAMIAGRKGLMTTTCDYQPRQTSRPGRGLLFWPAIRLFFRSR